MLGEMKDAKRDALTLLALFAGGAVPIQLITLSFGYAQYVKGIPKGPALIKTAHAFGNPYFLYIYVPALIVLLLTALYSRTNYPSLFRRITVGFGAGLVGTLALDAARQAGVLHGWLPGDTAVMFGKMVTGSKDFSLYYTVGLAVHYINGANFGLVFAFVWGRRENYAMAAKWGVIWLLIVELGMMTLPPMGPMTGLFGFSFKWPQLFLVTLIAHILTGLTIGLLTQHFLRDTERGGFLDQFTGGKIFRSR